jgi:hypothetical protein
VISENIRLPSCDVPVALKRSPATMNIFNHLVHLHLDIIIRFARYPACGGTLMNEHPDMTVKTLEQALQILRK